MKPRYEPFEPSIPKSKNRADPGAVKNALAKADDIIHKMAKRMKLAITYATFCVTVSCMNSLVTPQNALTKGLVALAILLRLDGVFPEFSMILVSSPVNTMIPMAHLVFLNTHPRKSRLLYVTASVF